VVFPLLIGLFGAVNLFTCNLLADDIAAVGSTMPLGWCVQDRLVN